MQSSIIAASVSSADASVEEWLSGFQFVDMFALHFTESTNFILLEARNYWPERAMGQMDQKNWEVQTGQPNIIYLDVDVLFLKAFC